MADCSSACRLPPATPGASLTDQGDVHRDRAWLTGGLLEEGVPGIGVDVDVVLDAKLPSGLG